MGQIEWAMWANENALVTCVVLILGGTLALAGQFYLWQIGVYGIAIGLLVFFIEYPRGKRQKGTSLERSFQKPFTAIVRCGKLLTRNYFIRFVIYIAMLWAIVQVRIGLHGQTLSFRDEKAAIKGEEWVPIEPVQKEQGPKVIEQPTRAPPRRPDLAPPRRPVPPRTENGEEENRV